MKRTRSGFTLIEMLVVIAVIATLAGLILPAVQTGRLSAHRTRAVSNLQQWNIAMRIYADDNSECFPIGQVGSGTLTWSHASASTNGAAWFNALPKLANKPGAGDYAADPAGFYRRDSLFYTALAKQPVDKLIYPNFSISWNSKLQTNFQSCVTTDISQPAITVVMLESGLSNETKYCSTQSTYNGQPHTFASRFVARYGGKQGLMSFADGHAGVVRGPDAVDSVSGKAYFPQSLGKVLWTPDPNTDANN